MPVTENINTEKFGIDVERLKKIEKRIQGFVNEGLKQAVILQVKRHGQTIFQGTYGKNTKDYGVQMDTIFPIFSISKPVIAALIMILQEDGLLDVADPVYWYLPELKSGDKDKISIWHLLNHTSGLDWEEIVDYVKTTLKENYDIEMPDYDAPEEVLKKYSKSLAEKFNVLEEEAHDIVFDKLMMEVPLKREPHTKMYYLNQGYQWLRDIVIKVSGKNTIDEAAKELLFDPLGMKDSHWVTPKEKWERIIGRGDDCEGMPYINSEEMYVNESGAGGLKSTIHDLMIFCEMIRNNGNYNGLRILSRASVKLMKKNQNDNLSNWDAWTLGFNYYENKFDDCGSLRTIGTLDHGGWCSARILIDDAEGISAVMFQTSMKDKYHRIEAYTFNMVYAALL